MKKRRDNEPSENERRRVKAAITRWWAGAVTKKLRMVGRGSDKEAAYVKSEKEKLMRTTSTSRASQVSNKKILKDVGSVIMMGKIR